MKRLHRARLDVGERPDSPGGICTNCGKPIPDGVAFSFMSVTRLDGRTQHAPICHHCEGRAALDPYRIREAWREGTSVAALKEKEAQP